MKIPLILGVLCSLNTKVSNVDANAQIPPVLQNTQKGRKQFSISLSKYPSQSRSDADAVTTSSDKFLGGFEKDDEDGVRRR